MGCHPPHRPQGSTWGRTLPSDHRGGNDGSRAMRGKARYIFRVVVTAMTVFVVSGAVTFFNIGWRNDLLIRWWSAFAIGWPIGTSTAFLVIPSPVNSPGASSPSQKGQSDISSTAISRRRGVIISTCLISDVSFRARPERSGRVGSRDEGLLTHAKGLLSAQQRRLRLFPKDGSPPRPVDPRGGLRRWVRPRYPPLARPRGGDRARPRVVTQVLAQHRILVLWSTLVSKPASGDNQSQGS